MARTGNPTLRQPAPGDFVISRRDGLERPYGVGVFPGPIHFRSADYQRAHELAETLSTQRGVDLWYEAEHCQPTLLSPYQKRTA